MENLKIETGPVLLRIIPQLLIAPTDVATPKALCMAELLKNG